jgi:alpha-D-ribose 1-methylphosphonate 5-triphosphate diphosphatase
MKQEKDGTLLITNARLVLADRVISHGWVAAVDGKITEIGEGTAPELGEDADGDIVMPGLVELHTDHLEAHYMPRPKVYWDPVAAVVSYDAQIATSGITTVLDSLRIWREESARSADGNAVKLAAAIATARETQLLRADHFLHLRCEVPSLGVIDEARELMSLPDVRLASLMDHTPGQRQFRNEQKLREYYRGKTGGMTDAELDVLFERRKELQQLCGAANLRALIALAREHGTPLASHDDTTAEHVGEAIEAGVAIAEFPTTVEAAARLHGAGICVLMGAPNLVRGSSHSGNVSSRELACTGYLDIMSSDYVPSSLLAAAVMMPEVVEGVDLATAVRTVTKTPAEAVGLADRGEITAGRRADLIRVRTVGSVPIVRSVWREGRRVA